MSMHLKHAKKRGFLSWEELGCLARALGFPYDVFYRNLPDELKRKETGISIKKLYHLIDFFKYFNAALDRTSNIHTDEWNLHVLKKAVSMLDQRVFSFSEILSIRMAYQVYESPDTKGLLIDEWVLMRALKMCGRTISPLKMMHRIKHMRNNFEEPERIQLHEFFDLLLWCEMYEGIEVKPREMTMQKDEKTMFYLDDFDDLLTHHDERLAARLNALYHKEEWRFTKEKHSNRAMPKDIPPVDAEVRRKQVRHHNERYSHLRSEVGKSQRRVFAARAGYVRPRPVSAPDLHTYEPGVDWSESSWTSGMERPHTVYEITRHLYAPSPPKVEPPDIREEVPRPSVTEYVRPTTPVAVTSEDVTHQLHLREALEFERETIDQKYERVMEEDQDYLLPGYRQRLANMPPKEPPREPTPPPPPREKRPSEETLRRLATNKRPGPTPAHGKACDARYRGWYITKARRGPHKVCTAPAYDLSPTGRLLTKLHRTTQAQASADSYAYRFTRRTDVDAQAALAFSTSVLGASVSSSSTSGLAGVAAAEGGTASGSEAVMTSMADMSSRGMADDVSALNTTSDSADSSTIAKPQLNTSVDSTATSATTTTTTTTTPALSRGAPSTSDFSDTTIDLSTPRGGEVADGSGDTVCRQRKQPQPAGGRAIGEQRRRKLGVAGGELEAPGSGSLFSGGAGGAAALPAADDAHKVLKDKVIEIRKVGRIEVLEEIAEKGEEEELAANSLSSARQTPSSAKKHKPTSAGSQGRKSAHAHHARQRKCSSSSSHSAGSARSSSGKPEHLDLHRLSLPSGDQYSLKSGRSDTTDGGAPSVSSVPYSRDVARLARSGPAWLSEIIAARSTEKAGGAHNRKACQRLAQRLGVDMSSELRQRLLCSSA